MVLQLFNPLWHIKNVHGLAVGGIKNVGTVAHHVQYGASHVLPFVPRPGDDNKNDGDKKNDDESGGDGKAKTPSHNHHGTKRRVGATNSVASTDLADSYYSDDSYSSTEREYVRHVGDGTMIAAAQVPTYTFVEYDVVVTEQRLRRALWSFFAGDALAAPTHWFYGGQSEIHHYYGPQGIDDYTKPVFELPGSVMNRSNPSGGGRCTGKWDPDKDDVVVGTVINHGKADLWDPDRRIHYHATLKAGENTLEAQLARVLMKSIVDNDGVFDADRFCKDYIKFMTTPGSHNDAYAAASHRVFFDNYYYNQFPAKECHYGFVHVHIDNRFDDTEYPFSLLLGKVSDLPEVIKHQSDTLFWC